ncbi:hypothetical protein [Planctomicrobium sp. SH664]|uniref:hypothetical protein n=1 Tax=Planctomicrobium sp. SH664 TaxID=3448125 RepID=UPI003F5B3233
MTDSPTRVRSFRLLAEPRPGLDLKALASGQGRTAVAIPVSCIPLIAVLCSLAFQSGCNSGESFTVAPVVGKVLCEGKPVSEGMVQFSPVASTGNRPGKTAAAMINSDGTFVLSTYGPADGAVIGTCDVMVGSADPLKPWSKELSRPIRFEVKPGRNEVLIEVLTDGTGKVAAAG